MDNKNNTKKKVIITILALVLVAIGVLFALKGCQKEEPVAHIHSYKINEEGTWICSDDNDILSNTDKPYVAILENNQPKDIIAIDSLSKTKINLGNGTIYKDGNNIYYSGNNAQTVIIKTQKVDDKQKDKDALVINAPNDTVYHYGSSTVISLDAVATNSFHEYGKVDLITLTKARVVLENKSDVKEIYLDINNTNYSYETTIIALKEKVELPRLTRDAVDLEEGEVKTLAIVQKLKDEVKTETNTETNEVIETVLEVQAADDDYVKIENVRKSNDELIIEAFLSPNADENDKTQTETQSTSTVTLEEAKEGSSHPASHNTFVPKQEKVNEVVKPTETKEEPKQEETKPVVTPTKKEEVKPEVTPTEDDTPSTPSHSHSYSYVAISDTQHKGTCSCGNTITGNHAYGTDNICDVCGYIENAVARIGNTYYLSLEDAVAAAQNKSVTIILLKDVDYSNTRSANYLLGGGKYFILENDTLDLNGHSISGRNFSVGFDGDNMTIQNGKFIGTNGASYGVFIGDGTYGDRIATGIVLQDIETVGGINIFAAEATIKELNSTTTSHGTNYYAVWCDEGADVTIESGTFTSYGVCVLNTCGDDDDSFMTVTGGNFYCSGDATMFGDNNNIVVKGGIFDINPSAHVPTFGYKINGKDPVNAQWQPIEAVDGKWTVTANPESNAEVSVSKQGETTLYGTLGQFRNDVNNGISYAGYTATLLKDIDLNNEEWTPIGTSTNPFSGIFDGANKTISNYQLTAVDNNGTGLFGQIKGTANANFTSYTDVWDGSTFNTTNIAENLYTCVVKNLNVSNVIVNYNSAKSYISPVVGYASNAYISDINVKGNSEIKAKYGAGILGYSVGHNVINNCIVDSSIKFLGGESDTGHYGGIVAYAQDTTWFVVENCINNANMSPSYGHNGGIAGLIPNNTIIAYNCINNGNIECTNVHDCGGIAGQAYGGYFISCTNNGILSGGTKNENNQWSFGGIVGSGRNQSIYFFDCVNKGNIEVTGYSNFVGGILGDPGSTINIVNCFNYGNLSWSGNAVTGRDKICYPINAKYANCTIDGKTYETISQLQSDIDEIFTSAQESGTLTLNNVTLTGGKGALSIPNGITSVTSNNDLFNEIKFNDSTTTQSVVVSIPNVEIEVKNDYVNKSITFAGDNSISKINGSLRSVGVSGNKAKLFINKDLSGSVNFGGTVEAEATIAENVTVKCANFNGDGSYTLVNNGTITNYDGGNHTIYTESPCNITIENHGKILNTKTGATYALLFYGNCNATLKAYNSSVLSTTYSDLIMANSSANSVKFMYEQGATINNAGVNKEYTSLAGGKVEVEEMAQN